VHHLIVFGVCDVITGHHNTISGHCFIAIFVVSPLHTTTIQYAATYISNGSKYCHNDISSGIASGKNVAHHPKTKNT